MPKARKSKHQVRKEEKQAQKDENLRRKNSDFFVRSLQWCAQFVKSGRIPKSLQGCRSYDMLWTRRAMRVDYFRRMVGLMSEEWEKRLFDFQVDSSDSPQLHMHLCRKIYDAYTEAYTRDYRKQIVDEERPIVGTSNAEYLLHKSFSFMVLFLYNLPYAPFYDLDDSVLVVAPALRQCLLPYTCLQVATDLLLMYLEESGYFGSRGEIRSRWTTLQYQEFANPSEVRVKQAETLIRSFTSLSFITQEKDAWELFQKFEVPLVLGEMYALGLMNYVAIGRVYDPETTVEVYDRKVVTFWRSILCQNYDLCSDVFLRLAASLRMDRQSICLFKSNLSQEQLLMYSYETWLDNVGDGCVGKILATTLEWKFATLFGTDREPLLENGIATRDGQTLLRFTSKESATAVVVLQKALLQKIGCNLKLYRSNEIVCYDSCPCHRSEHIESLRGRILPIRSESSEKYFEKSTTTLDVITHAMRTLLGEVDLQLLNKVCVRGDQLLNRGTSYANAIERLHKNRPPSASINSIKKASISISVTHPTQSSSGLISSRLQALPISTICLIQRRWKSLRVALYKMRLPKTTMRCTKVSFIWYRKKIQVKSFHLWRMISTLSKRQTAAYALTYTPIFERQFLLFNFHRTRRMLRLWVSTASHTLNERVQYFKATVCNAMHLLLKGLHNWRRFKDNRIVEYDMVHRHATILSVFETKKLQEIRTGFLKNWTLSCRNRRAKRNSTVVETKEAKQEATRDETERIDEDSCVVCLHEEKTHVLVPCGHQCICEICAPQLKNDVCPICREKIVQIIRVYK